MTNNDILSEFNSAEITEFKKDFMQTVKVGVEIDRSYGKGHHYLDAFIPKYEKLIIQFNKKYKGIIIKIKKTIEHFKVRIFFKLKEIKKFFAESASKIPGLKSIGRANFNEVDVSDAERFAKLLDSLLDKIFISYSDQASGTSAIAASFDRNEKMVELIYFPNELMNEKSAGFKLCAFYALKDGYDKKIEIHSELSSFGFSSLLNEVEKREWHERFRS